MKDNTKQDAINYKMLNLIEDVLKLENQVDVNYVNKLSDSIKEGLETYMWSIRIVNIESKECAHTFSNYKKVTK